MATTPLIRNAWTEQDLYAMLYSLGLSSREERHLATICGDALVDIVKRRGGSTLFPEQSEKLDELRRCILLSAMGPFVALDKYWPADEAKKARFYEAVYTIWFLYGLDGTSGGDGADRHVRFLLRFFSRAVLTGMYLVHRSLVQSQPALCTTDSDRACYFCLEIGRCTVTILSAVNHVRWPMYSYLRDRNAPVLFSNVDTSSRPKSNAQGNNQVNEYQPQAIEDGYRTKVLPRSGLGGWECESRRSCIS